MKEKNNGELYLHGTKYQCKYQSAHSYSHAYTWEYKYWSALSVNLETNETKESQSVSPLNDYYCIHGLE